MFNTPIKLVFHNKTFKITLNKISIFIFLFVQFYINKKIIQVICKIDYYFFLYL